jgi:hypothetical protein
LVYFDIIWNICGLLGLIIPPLVPREKLAALITTIHVEIDSVRFGNKNERKSTI